MKANNPGFSKNVRILLGILVCVAVIAALGIGAWTVSSSMVKAQKPNIAAELDSDEDEINSQEEEELKSIDPDCIMVLGAGVYSDGTPTPMLKDRLDTGIALYRARVAPKLLLSGDNGQVEYNEVEVMLKYTLEKGVPKEDIFLDHAGFSTYDSVYRASYIFQVKSMVVVTQSYHLYRALHGCKRMGIEALGVGADQDEYVGSTTREIREVLARDKDWAKWIVKPDPTYLGETIPITGDGTLTH